VHSRDPQSPPVPAIEYFLRHTYPSEELIIVDDSETSAATLVPDDAAIIYVKLEAQLTPGT
jgi:hypothetical protein